MSEDTVQLAEDLLDFINAVEAACVKLRMQIDKNFSPDARTTALPASEDFSALPWKSYATKQDAKPDEAGWIFANTRGAEALVAVLRTKDRAQISGMEYTFSGNTHQFISRKPAKQ